MEFLDHILRTDYGCHRLAFESGFFIGKHRLVGELPNHSVTIFARNILGGEHAAEPVLLKVQIEIPEAKSRTMKRTANHAQQQCALWDFIRTINLFTSDLIRPIQTNNAAPNSCPGGSGTSQGLLPAGIQ